MFGQYAFNKGYCLSEHADIALDYPFYIFCRSEELVSLLPHLLQIRIYYRWLRYACVDL